MLDGAGYTCDFAGNRTSKTNYLNGTTWNYGYDAIYELLQVTHGGSTKESFSYDAVGNRLSSLTVPSYSYNSSNELTANSNGSYTYDANGNTLSDSQGRSFTWDFENRLTQVVNPGVGTTTLRYDPFGRRIQKSGPLGTTNYLYDGMDSTANVIAEVDNSGTVLARYVRTSYIDEALSEFRSATASYYEQDGVASVTSLSSSAGALANTYTYDSFGKLIASTGTITNPFQYTARESDAETGLYFYRARYADTNTGRFISEDPIAYLGGVDFYAYVGNNPVNYFDPSGLCKEPNRFWNCVKNYYGWGTGTTRAVTIAATVPLKKRWLGLPVAFGSSQWTNFASWLALGEGTAASGANLLRMGGRIGGPVAIGGVVTDAAALAMCEADYVPDFIYTIAKYDPF